MKPILFFVLLVSSLSFSGFAQKSLSQKSATKDIQFKEIFTAVSIQDDINVVLTEGASEKISVEGNVRATLEEGHLSISACNPLAASEMKVYIPANFLTRVYMNSNGSLSSASVLPNQKIRIYLAAEARINVRSLGSLTVETINDIQFVKGR